MVSAQAVDQAVEAIRKVNAHWGWQIPRSMVQLQARAALEAAASDVTQALDELWADGSVRAAVGEGSPLHTKVTAMLETVRPTGS